MKVWPPFLALILVGDGLQQMQVRVAQPVKEPLTRLAGEFVAFIVQIVRDLLPDGVLRDGVLAELPGVSFDLLNQGQIRVLVLWPDALAALLVAHLELVVQLKQIHRRLQAVDQLLQIAEVLLLAEVRILQACVGLYIDVLGAQLQKFRFTLGFAVGFVRAAPHFDGDLLPQLIVVLLLQTDQIDRDVVVGKVLHELLAAFE